MSIFLSLGWLFSNLFILIFFSSSTETGRILPMEFSRWRNDKLYDPYKDIRRNLFFSYRVDPFRSTQVSALNLITDIWGTHKLHHELRGGVRMWRIHLWRRWGGSINLALRTEWLFFQNMHNLCFRTCSTYTLQSVHQLCKAEPVSDHFRSLKKGAHVCVECHPMAALDYLGGRCFGQGAHKRETRWSVLGKVGCRGTWVMESKMEECTCSSSHATLPSFSFIWGLRNHPTDRKTWLFVMPTFLRYLNHASSFKGCRFCYCFLWTSLCHSIVFCMLIWHSEFHDLYCQK